MIILNQQLKMNNGEDLTRGKITPTLLRFTLPMMAGAMMQQCYNIADTLIVGRFIGAEALAAVGSAYTLMVFITSVMLGLSMGSGTVFSLKFGEGNMAGLIQSFVPGTKDCIRAERGGKPAAYGRNNRCAECRGIYLDRQHAAPAERSG